MQKKYIHIDMDCFFAAVEMRDNPRLIDIPLAIGGGVIERGVISTANYPARRFGIHSGMPTANAMRLCKHLIVLPGRMSVYEDVSKQLINIFSRYTHLIEPVSLDEAYLDVSQCLFHNGSATLIANEIRQIIYNETGLTASAGVAPLKFLAKVASDINKPNGIFIIKPDDVNAFVKSLPLRKIPGVGPKTEERLLSLGLKTCGDVQSYDFSSFIKEFGKFGFSIWQRCHGIDDGPLCMEQPRKSVGVEFTLPEDISNWNECRTVIERLFPELEGRLMKFSPFKKISGQGIKFKFDDFQLTTHDHSYPILDLPDLLYVAENAWNSRRAGRGVRLVGLHAYLPDQLQMRQLPLKYD